MKNHKTFTTDETNTSHAYPVEGNLIVDEKHASDLNIEDEVQTFDTPKSNPRSSSNPVRPSGIKIFFYYE